MNEISFNLGPPIHILAFRIIQIRMIYQTRALQSEVLIKKMTSGAVVIFTDF
jgi:hypothetical protein